MVLRVGKIAISLLFLLILSSFEESDSSSGNLDRKIHELKSALKVVNRSTKGNSNSQNYLEAEIAHSRKVISLILRRSKTDDDELEAARLRLDSLQFQLEVQNETLQSLLVKDYIQEKTNKNFIALFLSESLMQCFKRLRLQRITTRQILKRQSTVQWEIDKLKDLNVVYNGSEKQRDSLIAMKTDVVIDNNSRLREIYATQFTRTDFTDSLRLELKEAYDVKRKQWKQLHPSIDSSRFRHPVDFGLVIKGFGEYQHTSERKILMRNNGIDIRTYENEPIYAMKDGEVLAIEKSDDGQSTIILNHGFYNSVYQNVKGVKVSLSEKVKMGQSIGNVGVNTKGSSTLHVEVWKGKEAIDPESLFLLPL